MRKAGINDLPFVMKALIALLDKSPAPQMKYADKGTAQSYVTTAIMEGRCFFVGPFFIMVDVGADWYSSTPALVEQIILKVYPGNGDYTVQDAINALPEIAKMFKCQVIFTGDTQIGMLTERYKQAGFNSFGTQLILEIHDGIFPQVDGGSTTG